jgi:hypothetical protein
MKTQRLFVTLVLLLFVAALSFGQLTGIGEPKADEIGIDSAQQDLKEISVNKFEDAGFWYSNMPRDQGLTELRRLPGGPFDKEPIPGEEEAGIEEEDKYVLGLKVSYYRRGLNMFTLYPVRPMPVEGITKTLSVWVVGRNMSHMLTVIISDYFGNRAEITLGKLNFSGWKKLTVAVPPSIVQRDFHYGDRMGIKVLGFKVETDPLESFGTYYIYFDDMRAMTDLFAENSRDEDDIADVW